MAVAPAHHAHHAHYAQKGQNKIANIDSLENNDLTVDEKPSDPTDLTLEAMYEQILHAHKQPSEAPTLASFGGHSGNHMFVDAERMKRELKEQLLKKDLYDVTNYYKSVGLPQKIARHFIFEVVTLLVIAFNGLWIAIDTDMNDAPTLVDAHIVFIIVENLFLMYFLGELIIRFLAFKVKRNCLQDGWFVFDSILVLTMVLETWVMSVIVVLTGTSGSSSIGNASILRLARLLRLTRMARMARLLRAVPELVILVKGMLAAMRSVIFTLVLMVLIIYIFAVAFRQVTDGSKIGEQYFESVPKAMGTLLNRGAFIDELSVLAEDITNEEPWLLILLYSFVLIASLTLMNMLVGVLVEVVQAVANTEKEALTISYVRERMEYIVKSTGLDDNGDGLISREEFLHLLNNTRASTTLASVDVDVVNLVDAADFIFQSDEVDEFGHAADKRLTFSDFMELVLSLRGTNNATVRDIVDLRKFVTKEFLKMEQRAEIKGRNSELTPCSSSLRARRISNSSAPKYNSSGGDKESLLEGDEASFTPCGSTDSSRQGRLKWLSPPAQDSHIGKQSYFMKKMELPIRARGDAQHTESWESESFRVTEKPRTVSQAHSPTPLLATHKSKDRVPKGEDCKAKGMLVLPGSSAFRRCAEAKMQRLLLELEEHHETEMAALRSENSRLLDALSTMWHASVWHVSDTESVPAVEPFRELY